MARFLTSIAILAVTIAVAEAYVLNIHRGPGSELLLNSNPKPKLDEHFTIHLIVSDSDDNSALKSEFLEKINNHLHLHLPCILLSNCNFTEPNPPTTVEPSTEASEESTTLEPTTSTSTTPPATTTTAVPYHSVEEFLKVLPQEFQDKLASYFKRKSIVEEINAHARPLTFPRHLRHPIFK
uniref:Uncharacterized protein n=1 Tax=Panagrellus redivivus TaxID=6233 RepID=A0A7E4VBP1_PANRE